MKEILSRVPINLATAIGGAWRMPSLADLKIYIFVEEDGPSDNLALDHIRLCNE